MRQQSLLNVNTAGDLLRKYRAARGLSQTDAANAIGVSRSHIAQLERGESNIPAWRLGALCDAYNLSPDETYALVQAWQCDYWGRPNL